MLPFCDSFVVHKTTFKKVLLRFFAWNQSNFNIKYSHHQLQYLLPILESKLAQTHVALSSPNEAASTAADDDYFNIKIYRSFNFSDFHKRFFKIFKIWKQIHKRVFLFQRFANIWPFIFNPQFSEWYQPPYYIISILL